MGRDLARSRICWKTLTRSTTSAAISGFGALGVLEFFEPGIRPGGLFDLLLLHQHLRGGLEALVLQQALDQFARGSSVPAGASRDRAAAASST